VTSGDEIFLLVAAIGIALIFLVRARFARDVRVFLTDFQRGIRYENGQFAGVLEPGSHVAAPPVVQIVSVDLRPHLFVIERLFFQDALGAQSVISISGSLTVSDPYLSVTATRDAVKDSIVLVREALRATASKGVTDPVLVARKKLADEIASTANADLGRYGMRVSNLEVTEVWAPPAPRPRSLSEAN
jgi:uncharacterized membrane protein YqiK